MRRVEALTASVTVGKIYEGRVTSVKDFGAFVEILPGKDGLCHISELSDEYVNSVADVCKVGDQMQRQGDRHRRSRPRQAQPQGAAARAARASRRSERQIAVNALRLPQVHKREVQMAIIAARAVRQWGAATDTRAVG